VNFAAFDDTLDEQTEVNRQFRKQQSQPLDYNSISKKQINFFKPSTNNLKENNTPEQITQRKSNNSGSVKENNFFAKTPILFNIAKESPGN
jgi:hypothetical protein